MDRRIERRAFAQARGPYRTPLAIDPRALGIEYEIEIEREEVEITHEDGVAIIDIRGPLSQRACMFDGYDAIIARFETAIASGARSILMTIGSPGGEVEGLFEACRVLRQLASKSGTPVAAYVDESAYSAAYALACVADSIYLPPAAGVGSIGVIGEMVDITRALESEGVRVQLITSGEEKADGNPHAPMTDAAIARAQKRVDQLAGLFFDWVAVRRGMKSSEVEAMQAACVYGSAAIAAGLADEIKSRSGALLSARLMGNS